jgi:ATP-binding cassette subfamily B protein
MKVLPKNPILFGIHHSLLHKPWVILAISMVILGTILSKYSVVILKNLTDTITNSPSDSNSIWISVLAYPLTLGIAELIFRLSGFSGMRWFMNYRTSAYKSLYHYLMLHSKDYFNSRFAGSLANKISNSVDGTESLFEKMLWQFIPLILGLFLYVIFTWNNNPILGTIIAVWSIFFLTINLFFAKKLQPRSYKYAQSLSMLKGKTVDSFSNISLVHEYAYIKGERKYVQKYIHDSRDAGLSHWQFSEWILFANNIFLLLFMLLLISVSVYLFQNKQITLGSVIMSIAIAGELSYQLLFMGQHLKDAAGLYGQAKEGLDEILQNHLIQDSEHSAILKISQGSISIDSINFHYGSKKVFQNFSLFIPAGQKVGIVGKSGAGKTTIVSLLLRHYEVSRGEIKLDNQDITQVTLESLRHEVGFVPQDTSLFHRTIKENISYSNPDASDEQIINAAKNANADDFIKELPRGYQTMVGERGVKLSGGQRQRIAIAGAFLKNAPILILDEATSSLDSESEKSVQESLDKLMFGKTVIAIAHRLSTLKKMDRIVVIDHGQIIEDGEPDKLLANQTGLFKKMWDHQIKGFIIDK